MFLFCDKNMSRYLSLDKWFLHPSLGEYLKSNVKKQAKKLEIEIRVQDLCYQEKDSNVF